METRGNRQEKEGRCNALEKGIAHSLLPLVNNKIKLVSIHSKRIQSTSKQRCHTNVHGPGQPDRTGYHATQVLSGEKHIPFALRVIGEPKRRQEINARPLSISPFLNYSLISRDGIHGHSGNKKCFNFVSRASLVINRTNNFGI